MYRLPLVILLGLSFFLSNAQSPHGEQLELNCIHCHTTDSWEISSDSWNFVEFPSKTTSSSTGLDISPIDSSFNHFATDFALRGEHESVDCRACHESLVFEEASSDCVSCHLDIHYATVGNDCVRCHDSNNWLVDNIPELHEENGFPLFGVHQGLSCIDCHTSESQSKFDRLGNECINCHKEQFEATSSPPHVSNGFSQECLDCHTMEDSDWATDIVDHSFFPLELGHDIADCAACHKSQSYSDIPRDCIGCHQNDFEGTSYPDHEIANFTTDCASCHTTNPNWQPAEYTDHDTEHFPIYSGAHLDSWTECLDCHQNQSDFSQFQCITCHLNPETDNTHESISGYVYEDNACLICHPTGDTDMAFNHDATNFPLTGAHLNAECLDCHENGYEGTSTNCFDCHTMDFEGSINPNHQELNLPTDCASCHTTDPEWMPATLDIHDDFYPLEGAHAAIANDCVSCHNGDYVNTPNECIGCHLIDYEGTMNPNHESAGFGTECLDCHSNAGWIPATFDHDAQFFPIYSGAHDGEWNECIDCHTNSSNFAEVSCTNCHINPETDNDHSGVGGYVYDDNACLACHPTGDADMAFDHNATNFPLTGAHLDAECLDCHSSGYEGTTTNCFDCHTMDFEGSVNPNHQELNLPTDCASCHTTDPEWMPATFDIHDDFYPLEGAHAAIANDCVSCHNGDYVNTPNDCIGCHLTDYEGTTNPIHESVGFGTECLDCHTNITWIPATFDHDAQYFPIYSGAHDGEWNDCIDCHTNSSNFAEVSCINCHINPETDNAHISVGGYTYQDNACLACHPSGDADMLFDHNATNFPLTGAHLDTECLDCHAAGYEGTTTNCFDCHTMDFEASVNPNHQQLNLPTDCASCHTTDPMWMPATFDIHDDFYPLEGAHTAIANDCVSCHNGDYVNTPNECIGCHLTDYEGTMNPPHQGSGFGTECLDCHTNAAWVPATFDHDGQYFPIYSGAHDGEWSACLDCHTNSSNFAEVSCTNCHLNPETNDEHLGVGGYVYEDNACLACHPTGDADMVFDHNTTNFLLTGAHLDAECLDCHANGFQGTTTNCFDCHTMDFEGSVNPDHQQLNLPTDCINCHTTDLEWMPATFDLHDDFYPLEGAHAAIANDCASCHNGDYVNTPNECIGCHLTDYEGTMNPNHESVGFGTECLDCHNNTAWIPTSFDHDGLYFPIYSGTHNGVWNECIDCHTNSSNFSEISCTNCHLNPETDNEHISVGGYTYQDNACLACHPTGDADMAFDHNATNFPLTGAHLDADCLECHASGFEGTTTNCFDCHTMDFEGSFNPDHQQLNLPTDCASCHTTDPEWMPATFDIHDDFYPLEGAHAAIANDCVSCHNGDYVNTPNECIGCHLTDYEATINPNHESVGFGTECLDCHTNAAWIPATFDHDGPYFPIYSGAHDGVWNECIDCHTNSSNFAEVSCINCHINPETDNHHTGVGGYVYDDNACLACHPTGDADMAFDHNATNFPLTGAHLDADCLECHANGFEGTTTNCFDCHTTDFQGSVNPDHEQLNIPTDCASCHTTDPEWMPATFDIHDNYYQLNGAHALIADQCVTCHNGDYNNTPNTCLACHSADYQGTTNPDHTDANFSSNCLECHTEDAWTPSNFDHGAIYPLNGAHADIATDCNQCHSEGYVNTPNTCYGCHQSDYNNTTNPDHQTAGFPTDCTSCHSESAWVPSTFDHDGMYFPIYSGKHDQEWNACVDCHLNPNDYSLFSCVDCHEHDNQNEVDNDHDEVSGYIYESNACLACHPTGED